MRRTSNAPPIAAVSLALALTFPAAAADGFYWGVDVGASLASDLSSTRTNVGVPTNCDQWLTPSTTLPNGRTVPLPLSDSDCGGGPRALPARALDFNMDAGLALGLDVGYRRGRTRFELSYFGRSQGGEKRPLVVPGDDKQAEFVERSEEIDQLRSHGLFANLNFDFASPNTKITPFLGFGLGATRVGIDYNATSRRNSDRDALLQLNRNPNAAGTTSRADESLSDTLFVYQFIGGVSYALNDKRSLNLKLRYGDAFGEFEDGDNVWKPLRDHESSVGPGGAPIHYDIDATEFGFWSLSVGMTFNLD